MIIPLEIPLILGALLFSVGILLVVSRKSTIMVLIGIELLLNAANLNFITFNQFDSTENQGLIFTLFVIVVAAAEISIAFAILLNVAKLYKSSDLDKLNTIRG